MADTPVKIDSELKKKIEKIIIEDELRFEYPSIKNFVDKAVIKMLKEVANEK